jgi:hypothetical protein
MVILGCLSLIALVLCQRVKLDRSDRSLDNAEMGISGHVQNGVVVFDGAVSLPEGAAVTVIPRSKPVIRVAETQKLVDFPLIRSASPGSVRLTNELIGEILDEEDASS